VKGLFVTGTDTGVGKTFVAAALLAAAPDDVCYAKPVQTGWPPDDDLLEVRRLSGASDERTPDLGLKLKAPVSPHHASKLEGQALTAEGLTVRLKAADLPPRRWIVEGAGGLLTPLSGHETMADLARVLGLPALVVVGVRLGAINATLLTLRALAGADLLCAGVVLVGAEDASLTSALEAHAPQATLLRVPRVEAPSPTAMREIGRSLLLGASLRELLG